MAGTTPIICGSCGLRAAANIISQSGNARGQPISWLQCPSCMEGSVMIGTGAVYPPAPAGREVNALPGDVDAAWREARTAHAVAAYTAAEMMLRKILMHVAVDKAGSTPGKNFIDYVNDLESGGYITTGLRGVVDQVRKRGNTANHELPASTEQDSLLTMTITEHLLEGLYELPAMVAPPPSSPAAGP